MTKEAYVSTGEWKDTLKRSFLIVLSLLLVLMQFPVRAYAAEPREAYFNKELINGSGTWNFTIMGSHGDGGSVTLPAAIGTEASPSGIEPAEGLYIVDLTPIRDAVDNGGLKVTASASVTAAGDAGASLSFSTGGNISLTAEPKEINIPTDATEMELSVYNLSASTATFLLSLRIVDTVNPTVTALAPSGWTNGNVTISISAADEDSGIERVEHIAQTPVTLTKTGEGYSFAAEQNGTYQFRAYDYVGNSATASCEVAAIDRTAPLAPEITVAPSSEWATSAVTATITGAAVPQGQSPETIEYKLGSGTWQVYGGALTLTQDGSVALSARVSDAAGNASGVSTKDIKIDTIAPVITASFGEIDNGNMATLSFTAADTGSGVAEKRYAEGALTADDYGSATVLSGNSVSLVAGKIYTVFAKDVAGNIALTGLRASARPEIDLPASALVNEASSLPVTFQVEDVETAPGALVVTAVSGDPDVLSVGGITNNNGDVTMSLYARDNISADQVVSITVTVQDSDGKTQTATLPVTVKSVNDAPVAVADHASVNEDSFVFIPVLANDTDEEGGLELVSAGTAAHGQAEASGDSVRYTPAENFNGSDTFTYLVRDTGGLTATGTVTVTVQSTPDLPVAVADTALLLEDEETIIDVLSNDNDPDVGTGGDRLYIVSANATTVRGGTVVLLNETGTIVSEGEEAVRLKYIPKRNDYGTDSFFYTISDQSGNQSTAKVTLIISAQNDTPVFIDLLNTYSVSEDASASSITFEIDDEETPSTSLMLQVLSLQDGIIPNTSLILERIGERTAKLTYKPEANQSGQAKIRFTLGDGFVSETREITIDVQEVNDLPTANADTLSYYEDTPRTFNTSVLIANDTDIEDGRPAFVEIRDFPAGVGTLTSQGAGNYTYTPLDNYDQDFSFHYVVKDDSGATATGVVYMKAVPENDAPKLNIGNSSFSIQEDTVSDPIPFTIFDQESDALSLNVTASSDNNTLISAGKIVIVKNADGNCTLTITPNENQYGTANITVTVSDGIASYPFTFTITVSNVPDAPNALGDVINATKGEAKIVDVSTLLQNDSDADGDALSLLSFTQPQYATVTVSDGKLTYAPEDIPDYIVEDAFFYTVQDPQGNTATAKVTVRLSGVNQAPVVSSISNQFLQEDFVGSVVLEFTVTDDNAIASVTATASPSGLVSAPIPVTDLGGGRYSLALSAVLNANGKEEVTVSARDNGGRTGRTTFEVTVYPVNDLPIAGNVTLSLKEDAANQMIDLFTVAGEAIADVESDPLKILSVVSSGTSHGTLRSAGTNGSYWYEPDDNYNGTDTYTYTVSDGKGQVTGSFTVTVSSMNDKPYYHDEFYKQVPNQDGAYIEFDITGPAEDVDDTVHYTHAIATTPDYGTVELLPDGHTVRYTRNGVAPGDGTDEFEITIRDRQTTDGLAFDADTNPVGYQTTNIKVHIAEHYGPSVWARNVYAERDEDSGAFSIGLDCGAPEGHSITVDAAGTTKGTVSHTGNAKTLTYTPNLNANGTDTFSYTITGKIGEDNISRTASITVTLRPINDAPEFDQSPGLTITAEDTTTAAIPVEVSDVDEGDQLELTVYPINANPSNPVLLPEGIALVRDGSSNSYTLALSPVENAYGDATVMLAVSDGLEVTQHLFTLRVTSVNDTPVALPYTYTAVEDLSVTFPLFHANSDVDHAMETLTVQHSAPAHGALEQNPDKTFTYTPVGNYSGQDSFTYQLVDPAGGISNTATVTLYVTDTNDPPFIENLTQSTVLLEDGEKTISFTIMDQDLDDVHTVTAAPSGANADTLFPTESTCVATISGTAGQIVLKPAENAYGSAILTVTVKDEDGVSATQEVAVTVLPVNDLPTAGHDSATLPEDGSVTLNVLTNDGDVEDGSLGLKVLDVKTTGAHGTVAVSADKSSLTYKPNANWYGTDTIQYRVVDRNNGYSNYANVTLTVEPVNDAPYAGTDTRTTVEDTPITIAVLENDTDVDAGDTVSLVSVDATTDKVGTAAIEGNSIRYTPGQDFSGVDEFHYVVTDGKATASGLVRVTVTPYNDAPVITNVSPYDEPEWWFMDEDVPEDFIFKAIDAETRSESLLIRVTSENISGIGVDLIPDTSIRYSGAGENKTLGLTPASNLSGDVKLTVTANDGELTATKEFYVRIKPVNDKPVLTTVESITTDEDTPYEGTVSVTDVESTWFFHTASSLPSHGTLTVSAATGNYTYTPEENYFGADSFALQARDDAQDSDPVLVQVTVRPVNDLPIAQDHTEETDEDVPLTLTFDELLTGASDVEDAFSALTVSAAAGASHGTLLLDRDLKTLQYTPALNYNGTDTFTYTVKDTDGGTDQATVTVTVRPVNDAPSTLPSIFSVNENATGSALNVLMGTLATDVEGQALEVISAAWTQPDAGDSRYDAQYHAKYEINDGVLSIDPDDNWTSAADQTVTLSYTVKEVGEGGLQSTGTLSVKLVAVNDAPTIIITSPPSFPLAFFEDSVAGGTVGFTIADEETPAASLVVTPTSNDADIISNARLTGGLSGTGNDRTINVTSESDANGNVTVTLRVSDGKLTDSETFTVQITPVNDTPSIKGYSGSTDENTAKDFDITAEDDVDIKHEGDKLTIISANILGESYGAQIALANVTGNAHATNVLRVTPDQNWTQTQSRTIRVAYVVQDAAGEESPVAGYADITIIPVNDAPKITISSPSSLQMNFDEDSDGATAIFQIEDEETTASSLTVAAASGDTDVIANAELTLGGTAGERTIAVKSLKDKNTPSSPIVITLTVKDSATPARSATATFNVTVNPVNDAPVVQDDAYSTNENTPKTLDVTKNDDVDSNNEGDTLTITEADIVGDTYGAVISISGSNILFTPDRNWTHTQSKDVIVRYKVEDKDNNVSEYGYATVTILPVNDAPVISPVADTSMQQKETKQITFTVTDEDDVPTVLTVSAAALPASIMQSVAVTAHPTEPTQRILTLQTGKWYGNTAITITAKDDENAAAVPVTFQVSVGWRNDNPEARDDAAVTNEDTSVLINVVANDEDDDTTNGRGQTLTVKSGSVTAPGHGTAVIESNKIRYTPASNCNGTDTFQYSVTDGYDGSEASTATVTVTVNPVNDPPVAVGDSASTNEDTMLELSVSTLLANDTDIDGGALSVTSVQGASHGTVSLVSGMVQFVPALNYNGAASFTYTISDGRGGSSTATVSVAILPVNDAPTANADTASTAEDAAVIINVLANDTDVENDALTVTAVAGFQNGTAVISANKVVFTPVADFHGTGRFTYEISDGHGGTASSSVTVTVTPVNDAPAAADDTASTNEDTPVSIPQSTLLSNDTDKENDTLTVTGVSAPVNGTVEFSGGTVIFRPVANFYGTGSFTYAISDGHGGTAGATVQVEILPVNDAPVALPDNAVTQEDTAVTVLVLHNDTDADWDELTVTHVSDVQHGTASISGTGKSVVFTPERDFVGDGSLVYEISDGHGGVATASVIITVSPVNDAPVGVDDTAACDEDTPLAASYSSLTANDTDIDGDAVSLISVQSTGATRGTLTLDPVTDTVTYVPEHNYNGPASFTYTLSDGKGGTAQATVRITIRPVNDAPKAYDDTTTVKAGSNVKIAVLANDSAEGDGDTLTVSTAGTPANGTAAINSNTITYTPTPGFTGTDTFTYEITDGALTAQATVTVTVTQALSGGSGTKTTPKPTATPPVKPTPERTAAAPTPTQRASAPTPTAVPPRATATPAPAHTLSDVLLKAKTEEKQIEPGEWANEPVTAFETDGEELLYRLKGEEEWRTLEPGEDFTFDTSGKYVVEYKMPGSEEVAQSEILVDLLPPEIPEVNLVPFEGSNAVTLDFSFLDDPGESGNAYLILPDGEQIPLGAGVRWTAPEDGEYVFTLVDKAGNTTTFAVPVRHGSIQSGNVQGREASGLYGGAAAAGLVIILFLIFWRPVRIDRESVHKENDKQYCTVKKRFAKVPDEDETLELETAPEKRAEEVHTVRVRFTKGFTRRMRKRYVLLQYEGRNIAHLYIEKDHKGRFDVVLPIGTEVRK